MARRSQRVPGLSTGWVGVSVGASRIERMSERLPEDLEGMAPGPELFWLLSRVDRDALSDADRVRLARARHRLVSHVQAELYADLYACTRVPVGRSRTSRRAPAIRMPVLIRGRRSRWRSR